MPVVPSNTFLNANLKELEVSGSIKLGNKTITKLLDSANVSSIITNDVDSAYIQLRQTTYDFLDSSEVISLIDSAYVQVRQTTYDFLDSSEVISLIDSAYVQLRQTSGGGSTNSYVEATSSITALANKKYIVDTSSAITITLPAVPSFGDEVKIIDGTNNADTNNITINRNSNKILGADSDFIIDVNRTAVDLVYYNTTQGWIISGNT